MEQGPLDQVGNQCRWAGPRSRLTESASLGSLLRTVPGPLTRAPYSKTLGNSLQGPACGQNLFMAWVRPTVGKTKVVLVIDRVRVNPIVGKTEVALMIDKLGLQPDCRVCLGQWRQEGVWARAPVAPGLRALPLSCPA